MTREEMRQPQKFTEEEKKRRQQMIGEDMSWRNQYPLSTFAGETRKELTVFIDNLLSTQKKELEEKIIDLDLAPTNEEVENIIRLENTYSVFAYGQSLMKKKILELINKDIK